MSQTRVISWARAGEIVGVLSVLATALIWLGTLNTRVAATEKAVEVTPSVATDVAVLKAELSAMKGSIEEVKREQRVIDERAEQRQEEILREIRARR